MTTKVYVVMGSAGEYSDRDEWCIAAYADEELAKQHVTRASERCRELMEWTDREGECWRRSDDKNKPKNEYDPDMREYYSEYYSDHRYFYYTTDLRETLP